MRCINMDNVWENDAELWMELHKETFQIFPGSRVEGSLVREEMIQSWHSIALLANPQIFEDFGL